MTSCAKRKTCSLVFWLLASPALVHLSSQSCQAQTAAPIATPQPTPPAPQEPIKIYTEEVLLPVVATDSNGRFDPTLEAVDLLILEDGEPQTIRSVRRIPASVLLLLDTGGFRNPAMKTNTTRDLAVRLVSQLRSGDRVAALQFGGKVELIQNWTEEPQVAIHSLETKLSSGRFGRLKDALAAASAQLKNAPPGNRHIVLVTDGGESLRDQAELAAAMEQLFTAQATVHVISYTVLGRQLIKEQHPKIPLTLTTVKPKSANDTANDLMHPLDRETIAAKLQGKIYLIFDTDFPMWRYNRDYAGYLKENEQWLAWLAEQSGGDVMLPGAAEELPQLADDLAREIDSQYVVTYRPKSGVALKSSGEIRRIEVVSRRVGLHVRSRRSHIVTAPSQ
jgi:VWFA-related protein